MTVRRRRWVDSQGKTQERWIVDVVWSGPDGAQKRVRKPSPINTRRGAEEFERQLRQSLLSGTYEAKTTTFASVAKDWLARAKTNNKHSTYVTKAQALEQHLVPALGDVAVADIDNARIERLKSSLLAKKARPPKPDATKYAVKKRTGQTDTLSKKTVNNLLGYLHSILALAHDQGQVQRLPKLEWLRAPAPSFLFLTEPEQRQLLAASEPSWRPLFQLALGTGLRLGELLALKWTAIDLTSATLTVELTSWKGVEGAPKGNRIRHLPLSRALVQTLNQLPRQGDYVFHDQGTRLTEGKVKWPLKRALKKAGLTKAISPHDLRHTFASTLVAKGVDLVTVQSLLGHADIRQTMRYAHLAPGAARAAVELVDLGTAH